MAEVEQKRRELTVCCAVPKERMDARADLEEEKLNRSSWSVSGVRPL